MASSMSGWPARTHLWRAGNRGCRSAAGAVAQVLAAVRVVAWRREQHGNVLQPMSACPLCACRLACPSGHIVVHVRTSARPCVAYLASRAGSTCAQVHGLSGHLHAHRRVRARYELSGVLRGRAAGSRPGGDAAAGVECHMQDVGGPEGVHWEPETGKCFDCSTHTHTHTRALPPNSFYCLTPPLPRRAPASHRSMPSTIHLNPASDLSASRLSPSLHPPSSAFHRFPQSLFLAQSASPPNPLPRRALTGD
eukprot:363694-Chlamydomonas_euryale.AAC.4